MLDRLRYGTPLPEPAETLGTDRPNPGFDTGDGDAIARLRAGDVTALDVLYQRYAGGLLHLATRLLASRPDAEDVVHDVFVTAVSAAAALRAHTEAGGWLRTLTINRCIDRHRAHVRREALAMHVDAPSPAHNENGDTVAAERIERAVAALPAPLRTVFILRAVEDHSHPEIARMLGIRVGTSEVRYHRAIRALRAALGDLK